MGMIVGKTANMKKVELHTLSENTDAAIHTLKNIAEDSRDSLLGLCILITVYSIDDDMNVELKALLRMYKPKGVKPSHYWWLLKNRAPRQRVLNKMIDHLEQYRDELNNRGAD